MVGFNNMLPFRRTDLKSRFFWQGVRQGIGIFAILYMFVDLTLHIMGIFWYAGI